MKEKSKNEYVRRSQRSYSVSFKLQVVQEIESGELTIYAARRKYGIQGGINYPKNTYLSRVSGTN